ncbi:MAG: hypothetical protein ABEJ61_03830 [Haloferacaceae archaeon]
MTAPTESEFASLLADLDRDGFARFLAALWTARGRPATVEEGLVAVAGGPTLRPNAPRRLPARLAVRRVDPEAADVVATTSPDVAALLRDRGVRVVGPAALHRALLYDLDRATADRIAREHLDRPFDAEPTPGVAERLRAVAAWAAPAALAVAVVAAVVGGVALFATAEPRLPADDGTPTFEPWTVEESGGSNGWVEDDEVSGVGAFEVAPGLTTEGVANLTELSAAHADAVRNRSYEWVVVYRRGAGGTNPVIDGGPDERARQVARVENGTESLVRVTDDAGPNRSVSFGTNRDVYTDGTARYVRRHAADGSTSVRRTPLPPDGGPAGLAEQASDFVDWILDASETDVVEAERRAGVTHYRLVGRGSRALTLDEYRVEAWITESGFVREMEVGYVSYGDAGFTYIDSRYRRVGTATVERPAWVPDDRGREAATAGGSAVDGTNGTTGGGTNGTTGGGPTATPAGTPTE